MAENLDAEDVELLEQLFVSEGIIIDLSSAEDWQPAYEDVTLRTISSLQQAVEELLATVEEVRGKKG